MPKLSVITVNLNNAAGLQKTMESVLAQSFTDYEYIIIDGGSTDGSKEMIARQAGKLADWVSEADTGIYNAMNKGIRKATGEYLLFLNSGDCFYSAESVGQLFQECNGQDLIYGNLLIRMEDGREWVIDYPEELTFGHFYQSSLPHQATLIRKSLFNNVGLYDEELKIVSDWAFFMKAFSVHNCTYKHVNEVIAWFFAGGISTRTDYNELLLDERREVLENNYGAFLKEYKEYFEMKPAINKYKNSRLHGLVQRLIHSPLYRNLKK